MKIDTLTKCRKPIGNSVGNIFFKGEQKQSKNKVRYKHYEEMSNDVLSAVSIAKAHKQIENSGKMRLYKSIPAIATGLIGTSIAIAQPGKLASKAGAGLGFLALYEATNKIFNSSSKAIDNLADKKQNKNNDKNKVVNSLAKFGLGIISLTALSSAFILAAKGTNKIINKLPEKVTNFISNETKQLTNEINSSKLGKFVENKINPFTSKHAKLTSIIFKTVAPLGIIFGACGIKNKTRQSLSKDLQENAKYNFQKGKLIQQEAKKHFNSINAIEV